MDAAVDDYIGDDLLRLMFICCHPLLSVEARTALTLRLLGGLTTDEIARAFLVRADDCPTHRPCQAHSLRGQVPFEVPHGGDFIDRLGSVLEVIYLVFNEGYTATAGERLGSAGAVEEALRLGRVLAGLVPDEPEALGLVALMEIQASRTRARVGRGGEPIPLLEQDRGRGTGCWSVTGWRRSSGPALGGSPVRIPCRPRSPPATLAHERPRNRLGTDRRALRRSGRADPVAGGGAQPSGSRGHGFWPAGRFGVGR